MYRSYYSLRLSPFRVEPDPAFLWLSTKHQEGLATLQYAILENKGFLLLSGDVGTGKTVLIHHLRNILPGRIRVAVIANPGIEILDLYRILTAEFDMPGSFAGKADFLIRFKQYLKNDCGSQPQLLIIIDEAHRLSVEMLDEIRVLAGIDYQDRKLINIFMVGQEELQGLLMDPRNQSIRQQVAVSYHLSPLDENEAGQYIRHRLKVAGSQKELFSPEAVGEIYKFSRGTPRLINAVCDRALLTGYLKEQTQIAPDTIRECVAELDLSLGLPAPAAEEGPENVEDLPAALQRPKKTRLWLWAALIGALGIMGFQVFSNHVARIGRPPEPVVAVGRDTGQRPPPPPPAATTPESPSPAENQAMTDSPGSGHPAEDGMEEPTAPPQAAGNNTPPDATPPKAPPAIRSFYIFFKPGSADLEDNSFPALSEVSRLVSTDPNSKATRLTLWNSADAANNTRLLTLRANCVKSFLAGRGVDARLTVVGRSAESLPEEHRPPENAGRYSWAEIRVETGNGD